MASLFEYDNFLSLHQFPVSYAKGHTTDSLGNVVITRGNELFGFKNQFAPVENIGCEMGYTPLVNLCPVVYNGFGFTIPSKLFNREYKVYIPGGTKYFCVTANLPKGAVYKVAIRFARPPTERLARPDTPGGDSLTVLNLVDSTEMVVSHDGSGFMKITKELNLQTGFVPTGDWMYIRVLEGDYIKDIVGKYEIDQLEYFRSFNATTFGVDSGDPIVTTDFSQEPEGTVFPEWTPELGSYTMLTLSNHKLSFKDSYPPDNLRKTLVGTGILQTKCYKLPLGKYKVFLPPGVVSMKMTLRSELVNPKPGGAGGGSTGTGTPPKPGDEKEPEIPIIAAIRITRAIKTKKEDITEENATVNKLHTDDLLVELVRDKYDITFYKTPIEEDDSMHDFFTNGKPTNPLIQGSYVYLQFMQAYKDYILNLEIEMEVDMTYYTKWYQKAKWDANKNPLATVPHLAFDYLAEAERLSNYQNTTVDYQRYFNPNDTRVVKVDSKVSKLTLEFGKFPAGKYKIFIPPGAVGMYMDIWHNHEEQIPIVATCIIARAPTRGKLEITESNATNAISDPSNFLRDLQSDVDDYTIYAPETSDRVFLGSTSKRIPILSQGYYLYFTYLSEGPGGEDVRGSLVITCGIYVDKEAYTRWYDRAIWDNYLNPVEEAIHTTNGSYFNNTTIVNTKSDILGLKILPYKEYIDQQNALNVKLTPIPEFADLQDSEWQPKPLYSLIDTTDQALSIGVSKTDLAMVEDKTVNLSVKSGRHSKIFLGNLESMTVKTKVIIDATSRVFLKLTLVHPSREVSFGAMVTYWVRAITSDSSVSKQKQMYLVNRGTGYEWMESRLAPASDNAYLSLAPMLGTKKVLDVDTKRTKQGFATSNMRVYLAYQLASGEVRHTELAWDSFTLGDVT